MATKTRYTEEFKKKVVEEYKKGDQSLEEVAGKYELSPALLQDWVNKEKLSDFIISYVEKPEIKTSSFTKLEAAGVIACQKLKANGWLLAGCMPLILCLTVFIMCDKMVVKSEVNEDQQSTEFKMDSLIIVNDEIKGEIGKLGLTLEKVDNELEMKIIPNITINNDNRKTNQTTRKTMIKNKIDINNEIKIEEPLKRIQRDTCCCHCPKNTIK